MLTIVLDINYVLERKTNLVLLDNEVPSAWSEPKHFGKRVKLVAKKYPTKIREHEKEELLECS